MGTNTVYCLKLFVVVYKLVMFTLYNKSYKKLVNGVCDSNFVMVGPLTMKFGIYIDVP